MRPSRDAALAGLVLGLSVALLPLPPATDWPQHVALSELLLRLHRGDPQASALFAPNLASHNAGAHLLLASLGRWIPTDLAGRLLLGLTPPLLLGAASLLLRRAALPAWRALLLAPATLGFCFGWGLLNFSLATALAWALWAGLLSQLERPRPWLAAALFAGSLALGITHVMAMLLLALVSAATGLEWLLRRRASLARVVLAGAPLLAGCLFDVWVYTAHVAVDAGAYTTPAPWVDEPGILRKIGLLGALLSGLFSTYTDTALAWCVVGLVGWMGHAAWNARDAVDAGLKPGAGTCVPDDDRSKPAFAGSGETSPEVDLPGAPRRRGLIASSPGAHVPAPGFNPASTASPAAACLLAALYLLTPSVVFNTHLIFQRLPPWLLVAVLLAIPALPAASEARARRWGLLLVGLYLVLAPIHLGLHHRDSKGAVEVLRSMPAGACITGIIEEPRTLGVRMHTLTHAAALGIVHGASDEAFSFARWLGLPVIYRPDRRHAYPSSSWEHDGRRYDPEAPLARRCPVALVHGAWRDEPTEQMLARLFGARATRVLARSGGWWLVDAR